MSDRVQNEYTLFTASRAADMLPCPQHSWRVVLCDNECDVCECSKCGVQRSFKCDFEDEYR